MFSYLVAVGVFSDYMTAAAINSCNSHIHVSLRDFQGNNVFAIKTPRTNPAYDDTRHLSEEGEQFLAGILDGISDGSLPRVFFVSH